MGNALQLSPAPLTTFHHNISEFSSFSQRHFPHLHSSLELFFKALLPSKLHSSKVFAFQGALRESRAPRLGFISGCILKDNVFLMFSRLNIKYVLMRSTGRDAANGLTGGDLTQLGSSKRAAYTLRSLGSIFISKSPL